MRQQAHFPGILKRGKLFIDLCACLFLVAGCASEPRQAAAQVEVAPFDPRQAESSYVLLEEQLFRYTNRFGTRISLASDSILADLDDPALRLAVIRWKNVSVSTMINLAVGPDVVTNLLDSLVVTTLSRLVLEDYWMPGFLGETAARPLIDAYEALEADIWQIADRVLTAQQQGELMSVIVEWHADNPDQTFPWNVRLDEFSGQRATNLLRVRQSGGLLGIRGAAQSVDDLAALAERLMFYIEFLPRVLQNSVQESYLDFLLTPQMMGLVGDMNRFVDASENLAAVISDLPNTRFEVVSQIMEGVGRERAQLFSEVDNLSPDAQATFAELRQSVEALERIFVLAGVGREKPPGAPTFDIRNFSEFAVDAAATARQIESTVISLETLLGSPVWDARTAQLEAATLRIEGAGVTLIDRLTLRLFAVIAFLILGLLVYQTIVHRIIRKRPTA